MSKNPDYNERDALQLQKLQLEVEALRRSLAPWYRRLPSSVGNIGALFIFLATVMGFLSKAAEVRSTREELNKTKSEQQALEVKNVALEARADSLQANLNDAFGVAKEEREEILHLKSERSALDAEVTSLKRQIDSLDTYAYQLQTEIEEHQRLMKSLADSALSKSPANSDMESLARTAIRRVYEYKKDMLASTISYLNSLGPHPEIASDGHDKGIRDKIMQLRKDIDEMETSYAWLKQ
jgi:chromosome segregation ATPase